MLLFVVGVVAASGSIAKIVLGMVTIVFFNAKARWEERRLSSAYPGYSDYAARTPRFVPRPRFHRA